MHTWKCPVCGYEAETDQQKDAHMESMADTPHRELMKEKAANAVDEAKDKTRETWEDIKRSVKDMTD